MLSRPVLTVGLWYLDISVDLTAGYIPNHYFNPPSGSPNKSSSSNVIVFLLLGFLVVVPRSANKSSKITTQNDLVFLITPLSTG